MYLGVSVSVCVHVCFRTVLSRLSALQSVKRLFFRWSQSWRDSNNGVYKSPILLCWSWFLCLLSCPSHLPQPPTFSHSLDGLLTKWHTVAYYMLQWKFNTILVIQVISFNLANLLSDLFFLWFCLLILCIPQQFRRTSQFLLSNL